MAYWFLDSFIKLKYAVYLMFKEVSLLLMSKVLEFQFLNYRIIYSVLNKADISEAT